MTDTLQQSIRFVAEIDPTVLKPLSVDDVAPS